MRSRLAATTILALLAIAGTTQAAVIVGYNFDASNGNYSAKATDVGVGAFGIDGGIASYTNGNPSSGKCIAGQGWKSGNAFSFTVTPNTGYQVILNGNLTFDDYKESGLTSTSWNANYRVGTSGGYTLAGTGTVHAAFTTPSPMNSLSLSGISSLQTITQATTIQLVATPGSNEANNRKWYIDNVTLNGETQALASLSTTVAGSPAAKVLVGTPGVQYVLTTTNNAALGGTIAPQTLNYTLGFASQTGLSLVTSTGSGVARGAGNNNTITVNTDTSGAKTGTLNVASTNAWQQSLAALPTVQVYQAASLTVSDGAQLQIHNAAVTDGGQRAAARLASLSQTGGDAIFTLSGLTAGGSGVGTVINQNSTATGTLSLGANPLNGTYTGTYGLVLETNDQGIVGTSAGDLGPYNCTVLLTVSGNSGNQSSNLKMGKKLKDLSAKSDRNKHTEASFLDGTLSDDSNVSTTWRDAVPGEAPGPQDLLSDVLALSGTGTGMFVLQMTYDPALLTGGIPRLVWNHNGDWVKAVMGNTEGTPTFVGDTAYDPAHHFVLGYYGVDTANHTAWAVLDHNSEFAVVPEPATAALLALGLAAILRRRRA